MKLLSLEPRPTVFELGKSVSVMLQNSYAPMMSVKPNVPAIIDVGGLHISSPKPLPAELKKFLDEAKHGVIFFSLGNLVLKQHFNLKLTSNL